ncbi:energy transducer TonB [Brevundimonas sp.]|uniref:energy transducer TonB n=1 Tax=Brevundimonas sp. TaxID=1871086 RepID=UPI0025FDB8C1|nr:energy transducer TonB [Brevundimonas sp.]
MRSALAILDVKTPLLDRRRLKKAGVVAGVAAAHIGLFALVLLTQPTVRLPPPAPPIEITLITPDVPPPPEPPRPVSREAGGGAPAAPSVVHVPPVVRDPPPPAFVAPPEPAPEPPQVIGASPIQTTQPGLGQGGQGTGTGTGVGAGSGPGSGAGRAVLISGPTEAQMRRAQPRTGLAVRRVGRAEMRCRIRLDQRLEGCVVTREMPPGSRLGQAAVSLAPFYRWRPPTDAAGRPQDNTEIVIGVDFPP